MKIHEYIELWKLYKRRLRSPDEYQKMQSFQAGLLIEHLRNKGVDPCGKTVLDLGCGMGGYSIEMTKHTSSVVSMDLSHLGWQLKNPPHWVVANALSIPVASDSFDIIICASLIEHVPHPLKLLEEIYRILKKGGYCYLGFPPFYSVRGGHEFSPFHYLGEKWAIRLHRFQAKHPQWVKTLYQAVGTPTSFSHTFKGWGLFPLTIRKAKQLVKESGFEIRDMTARYMPINVSKIPLAGEILTSYVQFLLVKGI